MRRLIFSLAAVSLVLFAEKALCRGSSLAIEQESFNSLSYQDFRVKELELRTRGTGRFLSVDPGGFTPSRPQSWNRYAYVENNPVSRTDPNGRECLGCMALERDIRDVGAGTITREEFRTRITARAVGGAAGLVILGLGLGIKALYEVASAPDIGPEPSPQNRGRANEAKVLDAMGMNKNTQKISGTEGSSIPDGMDPAKIVEIKDTKTVSDTKQLRIQRETAQASGRDHVVVTGTRTHVTKPVTTQSTVIRRDDIGPPP